MNKLMNDRFATELAGISIVSVGAGKAICEMPITSMHLNARGTVMGGAIFTLADYTAAVAANAESPEGDTITMHGDITFLNAAKGSKLIATAHCIKSGRTLCLYEVMIIDEQGSTVAHATMNGFTLHSK